MASALNRSPTDWKRAHDHEQSVRQESARELALQRELARAHARQAELEAALDEARVAVKAKSDFLAHMSHELRSPMTAVVGFAEILLDTPLTGEQREMLGTVRQSADALVTMVNQILDFSKVDAKEMQLENRPFELRRSIEECLDLMAPIALKKDLDLAYEVDPDTPDGLVGDASRLKQILVNLMGNAIKFTEKGEVVVKVNSTQGRDSTRELQFTVQDSGPGIEPDRIDRLFDPYAQADASTARRHGGTGLGLSISRGLAELMNGTMWAESALGVGSAFHFTIVCGVSSGSIARKSPSGPLSEKHVLLIEPSESIRGILTRQLKEWGVNVHATPDVAQAVEWLRSDLRFHMALLNRQAQTTELLTVARELRSTGRDLPLVLMTSLQAQVDPALGARLRDPRPRPIAYVAKPIKPSRLHDALVSALPGASRDVQPSHPTAPSRSPARAKKDMAILVVDDQAAVRNVTVQILWRLGFQADAAASGAEALEAVRGTRYDLVLTDLNMPEMSGLKMAVQIWQGYGPDQCPYIVAVTGTTDPRERERCLASGIHTVLQKPWELSDFKALIDKIHSAILAKRTGHSRDFAAKTKVS